MNAKVSNRGTLYYVHNGEVVSKVCSTCAELKDIDAYVKNKRGLGGRHSVCRACRIDYHKEWRNKNADRVEEYEAERRDEKMAYKKANYSKIRKINKAWEQRNLERRRMYRQRRRARKIGVNDSFDRVLQEKLRKKFGDTCALTGKKCMTHYDHVLPLATGHGEILTVNIIPIHPKLNLSKGSRNVFEWFETDGERMGVSNERFNEVIAWLAEQNGMSVKEYRDYLYYCHANPRNIHEGEAQ